MQRIPVLGLTIGTLLVLGCEPAPEADAPPATVAPPAEQPAAPSPGADLADPEVAHVAVRANRIDADIGQLASDRAEHPDVRAFAERMVQDHEAVIERATELAQRLNVTPAEHDISRSLQQDAAATRSRLEGLSGAEFDRAYIQHEVQFHQNVLDALDSTLIPSTDNAELRSLLEEAKALIESHLEHARNVQNTLGAA
jgi:putative membrane protein